jgi:hypothetical protein
LVLLKNVCHSNQSWLDLAASDPIYFKVRNGELQELLTLFRHLVSYLWFLSAVPLSCNFTLLIQHLTLWGYIYFLSDFICEKSVSHLAFYHWTKIKMSGIHCRFMTYHWALILNIHDDCISNAIQESLEFRVTTGITKCNSAPTHTFVSHALSSISPQKLYLPGALTSKFVHN